MTYTRQPTPINLSQLRHPSTLAKITQAWLEVIEVSEARKGRVVRYVLDRKGKEWIRLEKSPGQMVIATFRGHGSLDQSHLIRKLLQYESVHYTEVPIPSMSDQVSRLITRARNWLK